METLAVALMPLHGLVADLARRVAARGADLVVRLGANGLDLRVHTLLGAGALAGDGVRGDRGGEDATHRHDERDEDRDRHQCLDEREPAFRSGRRTVGEDERTASAGHTLSIGSCAPGTDPSFE